MLMSIIAKSKNAALFPKASYFGPIEDLFQFKRTKSHFVEQLLISLLISLDVLANT